MKTAFPQFRTPVDITLYSNVPFDNTYKNHTLISSKFKYNNSYFCGFSMNVAKERFLNRKNWSATDHPYYYPRYALSGDFNFDYANGLISSVVLELTPEQTNANYMKVVCQGQIWPYKKDTYYYFITGIQQINYETFRLSLELDVLMTYQDEFLEGMQGVPVFTNRKHCHRYVDNGRYVHCADLKMADEIFAGIKPSIITDFKQLNFSSAQMKKISNIKWLYICTDQLERGSPQVPIGDGLYTANGCNYPLTMLCVPLNVRQIIYKNGAQTTTITYTVNSVMNLLSKLIGSGIVHGTKISNFPPFTTGHFTLTSNGELTICADSDFTSYHSLDQFYKFSMGNNEFAIQSYLSSDRNNLHELLMRGCMIILKQQDMAYRTDSISVNDAFKNSTPPTPLLPRYIDPKLLFAPFTKYVLGAKYSSEGCELHPELLYSEYMYSYTSQAFDMYASAYIGDNNYYTKPVRKAIPVSGVSEYCYDNYQYAKIGLAGTVNYNFPAGTDALEVFNATQQQAFYTSKTASGIASGITMASGIGSIALGVAGFAGGAFTGGASAVMGAGLIAGGASALASGTAGLANTIKSTNAKIEDLKNTPDSINISGSNFVIDDAITDGSPFPYLLRYECGSATKEQANDFFYRFGYQVARECYFNTELKYVDAHHKVDNDLFGRTIFNYIQLQDDIVNKINADIPLIAKQKLSKIFNDGITLWSFFGFEELWTSNLEPPSTYYIDKWLFKCDLDNTECNLTLGS